MLKRKGCTHVRALVLVAAPEGIALMDEKHPDVDIYTASIDSHLNEHGYIIPGWEMPATRSSARGTTDPR